MSAFDWILLGFSIAFLFLILMAYLGHRNAPLWEDDQKTPEKPFAADAAPPAPEGSHGCYIEDNRTRDLREAYASRRRTHRSKRAIEDLIRNVGRN